MKKKKAIFHKGLYKFFAVIENIDERKDAEKCQCFEVMTSKKQADTFLRAFVSGLTYQNESLKAKEYGWEIMPDSWDKLK